MPYFRKKPVVIEAFRFGHETLPRWAEPGMPGPSYVESICDRIMTIHTLEGRHTAHLGDWIIRGVAGELYPCKRTCFWLHNLPPLVPTHLEKLNIVHHRVHRMPPSPDRWKERSRFFPGIAAAMAEQWGPLIGESSK